MRRNAPRPDPVLPCPECRRRGKNSRIGTRISYCPLCNRFHYNITRTTATELKKRHPEEWKEIRLQKEIEWYRRVIADWQAQIEAIDA